MESHSFNIFALFKNHYSTTSSNTAQYIQRLFSVKPLILFCNKIITIRIFYKTVIRSETEIIILTPTLSWNLIICHFLSFKVNGKKKKEHFFFSFFFLQTDKLSAKAMFARNAFVLFLHNTAFCKRKLHQIATELIFLWIIVIFI